MQVYGLNKLGDGLGSCPRLTSLSMTFTPFLNHEVKLRQNLQTCTENEESYDKLLNVVVIDMSMS